MVHLTLKEYIDARNITRYQLSQRSGVQYQTLDKYYKDSIGRYDSDILSRICEALDCTIGDILEYVKDETD